MAFHRCGVIRQVGQVFAVEQCMPDRGGHGAQRKDDLVAGAHAFT